VKRINIYYRKAPVGYKYFSGDRVIVSFLRKLFFKQKVSGLDKVFINLCKGFDELKINYTKNLPFKKIQPDEPVIVLGVGKYALQGYEQSNKIIAGIGLMTFPEQWPGLLQEFPVVKYLQHSKWAKDIYVPYFGETNCAIWPSGVDTQKWRPDNTKAEFDILIYDKIMWNKEQTQKDLKTPILNFLSEKGIVFHEITYGNYAEHNYFELLKKCRAMIFLCEHESQGFAVCEALAMDVPVFAWNQGYYLDPNRQKWDDPLAPASSVPFFSKDCGMTFKNPEEFSNYFDNFWLRVKNADFSPRKYVVDNLTLTKSAETMLDIINEVYCDTNLVPKLNDTI